ncbi:MAG TPA: hypothetical protein VKO86_15180, partial [Gemmatimonadales bacterium]|nr:hypothetical protein [Gemmatimonadales bacterium]
MARGLLVVVAAVSVATCRVTDLVRPPKGPILKVVPTTMLTDSAAVGSTARHSDPVAISNEGDGDLHWNAHTKHASPWL